jgi:hypothetical protein
MVHFLLFLLLYVYFIFMVRITWYVDKINDIYS